MGKILLIEPQKILQQAISLSLFPEHEVRVENDIASGVGSFKDYDLLIVDGAALRESNRLSPEAVRIIQSCKTPTLWLEEDPAAQAPKREKFVVVKKPIEKETLQSALAGLLSPRAPSSERRRSAAAAPSKESVSKAAPKKKGGEISEQSAFQFIDLVDAVEEEPPPMQRKKGRKKSK
ncbi:hypothetical protein EPO44_10975 [bacterium]|nr:MAG: hypothetical protein EPO44_10975 [bacterium]